MKDLFGNEIKESDIPAPIVDMKAHRRELARKYSKKRGYASEPGTGPEGETCATCEHSYYVRHSKKYFKCGLVKPTHGPKTDIKIKSPACRFFEKHEQQKGE